ncbi:hypothetical protein N2152v2_010666 [Parachlorella kessleri]
MTCGQGECSDFLSYSELAAVEQQLRQKLASGTDPSFEHVFGLATTLHRMDYMAPNGGRRVPEAARLRAIQLAPSQHAQVLLWGSLGALLLSAGEYEGSLEAMDTSLQLAEGLGLADSEAYVGNLFNKAKLLDQTGRQQEAQELLAQVVSRARGVAPGTYAKAWASIKDHTPGQLKEMEACARYLEQRGGRGGGKGPAREGPVSAGKQVWRERQQQRWGWMDGAQPVDEAWLHYALFAAHDKLQHHATAWRHLEQANRLQRSSLQPHSTDADEQLIKGLQQMFMVPSPRPSTPAEVFYSQLLAGRGGYPSPAPIFVVGLPRSGSTLIEQILSSHSQVWGAGEDTALAPLLPSLTALLQPPSGEIDASEIARVGYRYVEEMKGRAAKHKPGAERFVDKMLRNAWNIGFISFILPQSCIIHAERHPAATGLSCYAQPFEGRGTLWAFNLSEISQQIRLTSSIMQHWDRVLPGKVLHVRYEDLVNNQEEVSRRMLAHCGVPWEEAVLQFHRNTRAVSTASAAQVRRAIYTSSLERWKAYKEFLPPLLRPLRDLILQYEADAGLPSSAELLSQVLDRSAQGSSSDSGVSEGEAGHQQPTGPAGRQQVEQPGGGAARVKVEL